jgi:hypothetical protein
MGSGRSFPAYSYQSSSEFILPKSPPTRQSPSSDEEEERWEAMEEYGLSTVTVGPPGDGIRWIEKNQSVVSIVNEIDRIKASRVA